MANASLDSSCPTLPLFEGRVSLFSVVFNILQPLLKTISSTMTRKLAPRKVLFRCFAGIQKGLLVFSKCKSMRDSTRASLKGSSAACHPAQIYAIVRYLWKVFTHVPGARRTYSTAVAALPSFLQSVNRAHRA